MVPPQEMEVVFSFSESFMGHRSVIFVFRSFVQQCRVQRFIPTVFKIEDIFLTLGFSMPPEHGKTHTSFYYTVAAE
jgi:hypothetical protein